MHRTEQALELLLRFDDWLTEKANPLVSFLGKPFGVRQIVTHNREERVKLFTDFLRTNPNVTSIQIAAGGGELDEIVEALLASRVIEKDSLMERIRITQTPIGPAPVEVRQAWVGTEIRAIRSSVIPDGTLGPETDWFSGKPFPQRETYMVLSSVAVQALEKRDSYAASWFKNNLPEEIQVLSFGVAEVEVLPNKTVR